MKKENGSVPQMDTLCKAGCIISIISSCIIVVTLILWGIIALTVDIKATNSSLTPEQVDAANLTKKIMSGVLIFIALIQLIPLYFTISLLKARANSNIPAGIVALIFTGLLGGILILVGKYKVGSVTTTVPENAVITE